MPKSRHRRKGRTRRATTHPHARHGRVPEPPRWLGRIREVDALEAAGDVEGALRLVRRITLAADGHPMWRPERTRRLAQLEMLGDAVPSWAWGRWIVSLAAECTPGRPREAYEAALKARGGCPPWEPVEPAAMADVIEHDWVYRQLVLHEYGGLERFLDEVAGPALVTRAAGIRSWVGLPMGAYEFLLETTHEIFWWDLGANRPLRTVNLGGAVLLAQHECVIGRVVESAGVSLFESAPLCVPLEVARQVVAAPDEWVEAVAVGCRGPMGGILRLMVGHAHDFDLFCDLASHVRRTIIQPPDADGMAEFDERLQGAEYDAALVLAALEGDLDVEGEESECTCGAHDDGRPLAPLVAAALLEPGTLDALRSALVSSDAIGLSHLAGSLAAPADEVCRRLALASDDATT